ncbi:RagB/SusD family nutrient uptake outer membrane protein [uncultured Bacteroides sp.]|uniref:RagB/SusD family nutrient uptake outer membrane protein n=1 Tax=uncultured Bacteroides sp. TaxID=162156 RepID=UPI002591B80C|nr:RagB/SusD family nutrient uptake outer membrane protein [uncultured Bacteroides sp.]
MKKNILLLAMSAALFTTSCSDFLDVQPEGNATTTTYFTNDQQAIDAVDALYERFHQETLYGRELFWEQGAACDVVWGRGRGYNSLATLRYTGDESPLRDTFKALYVVMGRANWAIEQLVGKQNKTTLTAIEKRSLGEAYFTRGWAHFLVAYRYGLPEQGVPFIRYEYIDGGYDNSIPPQQASVIDNYKLIIEDMDKAIECLPRFEEYGADDRGRAHDAAAVAFKAKVYAYWATWDATQWENVIKMVNELETVYGRNLAETFAQSFSSDFSDWWNKEYIWTIPGNGGSQGGGSEFPGVSLENKGWGIYNGWGQNKPSYDIYEEMAKDGEGNDRLVRSILEYGQEFEFFGETRRFFSASDVEAGFMFNKYLDPFKYKNADTEGYVNTNGNWPTVRLNFPIIRFAEMLLFRAEAYLMTNKAASATADLNRIRLRSNLTPLAGTATMKDLYHERRCELAFEFTDHLFDLKRWHRSSNAEIKALAAAELNAHPRVRHYADRSNPDSDFTIGDYQDYQNKATYQDYMMVFPYEPSQITKSNGKLKQNPGYN